MTAHHTNGMWLAILYHSSLFTFNKTLAYPSNSAVSMKQSPLGSLVVSSNTSAATNWSFSIRITSPTCTSAHFSSTSFPSRNALDRRLFTCESLTWRCCKDITWSHKTASAELSWHFRKIMAGRRYFKSWKIFSPY